MKKPVATVVLLLCLYVSGALAQTPQVALVNAASYEAAVAPGSIAALFGNGLATQTQAAATLPLPTALAGTSVKIGGRAAPLFFASPSQFNLQVPSGLNAGTHFIEVFTNNATTPTHTGMATIGEAAPGIFTLNANGNGQAAALNADF